MLAVAWVVAFSSLQSGLVNPPASIRNPQTATQTVCIDLIALDARGRVLENLKSSDFELHDDDVPQAIEGVRFVRSATGDARLVAIFLDEYHIGREATDRVREALTWFVDQHLRPNDLLVVMKPLDSIFAIRLTTDRETARARVSRALASDPDLSVKG